MKVLITGATGFIGRHLAKKLLSLKKYQLVCFVRSPQKARELESLGAKLVCGDITDKQSLNKLNADKFDLVFHCAGYVNNGSRKKLQQINVEGTKNICEFCLNQGVNRLVYLSSVAVVSGNFKVPLTEDLPFAATNYYGESKIAAERAVLNFRKQGLKVVILRPPIVYGEDEPHALKFMVKLIKLRLLPLLNQGNNKLHLVYVENLVAAMLFSLDLSQFLEGSFFVADQEVLRVSDIFGIFAKAIGAKAPFRIPAWLDTFLANLPGLGKRIKILTKDRVYSLEGIESLGFKPPYPTRSSLVKSAKELYYGKH